jgi:hypothetical protein
VLAREHLLGLGGFHLRLELVEPAGELGGDVLAGGGPLEEHAEVLDPARQRVAQLDVVGEPAPALQRLLGLLRIAPEAGVGNAGFERGQLVGAGGTVKDSSADRWPA